MDIDHESERRHPRVDVRMEIRISTIDAERDPGNGKPYFRTSEETCANVSRGGAFVLTHEPIEPGRRLLVEMTIPGGPNVQAIGRVAWSKAETPGGGRCSGIGVEFLGGSSEQLGALDDYITRMSRPSERTTRSKTPPRPPVIGMA
jgi:Tfp pilus assembly protein PilZ